MSSDEWGECVVVLGLLGMAAILVSAVAGNLQFHMGLW